MKKRLPARFFRTTRGREPVREWLVGLGDPEKKMIGQDIMEVELTWPTGMPLVRPLGNGLYEVRSKLADRIARVIFLESKGEMILLHGFIKKSQKTPKQDLDTARKRAADYRRSNKT